MSEDQDDRGRLGRLGEFVGAPDEPDTYELLEFVGKGGEGETWRARRMYEKKPIDYALKIILPKGAERLKLYQSMSAVGVAVRVVLANPHVNGIEPPFIGHRPHARGETPKGPPNYIYQPSRWVNGVTLLAWGELDHDLSDRLRVVTDLAAIIDALVAADLHHRDIAPDNVMVSNGGEVVLIDPTRLRLSSHLRLPRDQPTRNVKHGAWSDPEGGNSDAARDRYAYGTIVGFLLSGLQPEEYPPVSTRANLLTAGFSSPVIDHIELLLGHPDARMRPPLLEAWARELDLLVHAPVPPNLTSVSAATNGSGTSIVIAGGARGAWRAALHDDGEWRLEALAGPAGVRRVAAARNGRGEVVAFALDASGNLTCWRNETVVGTASGLAVGGALACCSVGDGSVVAAAVSAGGQLVIVTCESEGVIRESRLQSGINQLLDIANLHGSPVVLGAELAVVRTIDANSGEDMIVSRNAAAVAGRLYINSLGDPEAALIAPDGAIRVSHALGRSWSPLADVGAEGGRDVAVSVTRSTRILGFAAADGIAVFSQPVDSRGALAVAQLGSNVTQVAFTENSARQLRLVALTDEGQVRILEEAADHWTDLGPLEMP